VAAQLMAPQEGLSSVSKYVSKYSLLAFHSTHSFRFYNGLKFQNVRVFADGQFYAFIEGIRARKGDGDCRLFETVAHS
jgi:hypothetical protein